MAGNARVATGQSTVLFKVNSPIEAAYAQLRRERFHARTKRHQDDEIDEQPDAAKSRWLDQVERVSNGVAARGGDALAVILGSLAIRGAGITAAVGVPFALIAWAVMKTRAGGLSAHPNHPDSAEVLSRMAA